MTAFAPTPSPDIDEDALGAFAESIFGSALATMETTLVHLGLRLGLYEALRGNSCTPSELAAAATVDTRYAREWLEQQAAAGNLTVDDPSAHEDDRRFTLPEEHAIVLLDREHPAYSGAMADVVAPIISSLDLLADAFGTGAGVPYAAYGLHDMQAAFSRPMFANDLVSTWIPALPEVQSKLEAGEPVRVADFGCGEGWACIYVAEAYPNAVVDGFDLDDASIAAARKHAADRGVGDRVRFEVQDVTEESFTGTYDLVMATEVIHDLADPVDALAAMRRMTRDGGSVLIVDENAAETFDAPADEIQRLLYAFSVIHCLPAGRTHERSAATGTVMRPSTFEGYARAAGFATVDTLPVEHDVFRFYRLDG